MHRKGRLDFKSISLHLSFPQKKFAIAMHRFLASLVSGAMFFSENMYVPITFGLLIKNSANFCV